MVAAILWILGPCAYGAPASPSPAPSASAAPAATPIALPDVVPRAADASAALRTIGSTLETDQTLANIRAQLPAIVADVDRRLSESRRLVLGGTSLDALRALSSDWRQTRTLLDEQARQLATLGTTLQNDLTQLRAMHDVWLLTRQSIAEAGAPAEVLGEIDGILSEIDKAKARVHALLAVAVSTQNEVSEQQARVKAAQEDAEQLRAAAVGRLWDRDSPPLWSLRPDDNVLASTGAALATQLQLAAQYADAHVQAFLVLLLLFAALWLACNVGRRRIESWAAQDTAVRPALTILETPVAAAMLGAILISMRLFPQPPALVLACLGAAALLPTIRIMRRLVSPSLFVLLDALVVFFILERVRDLVEAVPIVSRTLFLVEMLLGCAFLVFFRRHLRRDDAERPHRLGTVLGLAAFVLLTFAALADLVGNVGLAVLVGRTVFRSANLAIMLYGLVDVLDALAVLATRVPPLSTLHFVDRHRDSIHRRVHRIMAWLAAFLWITYTLEQLSVRAALFDGVRTGLGWRLHFGAIDFSLGDVAAFALTVWASFALSGFIRFIMEEDVYPRMRLGRGVPYAITTLVHYCVLLMGFLFALSALGVDMSRFAVLAGAFGVGIGFGLQTIVNNFVSGLILLFERPVKVGDAIQIADVKGTVKYIGIRASLVRTWDMADVVVPNGSLLSERVWNWTFSSTRRGMEIAVGVEQKAAPKQVLEILSNAAKSVEGVLKDPAPKAFFDGYGERASLYRLRAWTDKYDQVDGIKSRIMTAVNDELVAAGIEIPFDLP